MAQIHDGRSRFHKDLVAFYADLGHGVVPPPLDRVASDAEPAVAYANPLPDGSARWIADCPDCAAAGRTRAQYVWLETPLFWCIHCGNRAIGGRWRPVALPSDRRQIEALLLARPDPATRAWGPHLSLADLRKANRALVGVRDAV